MISLNTFQVRSIGNLVFWDVLKLIYRLALGWPFSVALFYAFWLWRHHLGRPRKLIRGVHTRHFKCTWSVFEVHLKRTCVWTDRNGSCCTWLIVLSRHGNLKTSKSRSALSSMVSTLLESALIQWKHRKLITNLSVTWSDQFHSRAREQNFVVDYRELWRFINSHRRMISST